MINEEFIKGSLYKLKRPIYIALWKNKNNEDYAGNLKSDEVFLVLREALLDPEYEGQCRIKILYKDKICYSNVYPSTFQKVSLENE